MKDSHAGNKEKGNWFEKLCRHFFKNDPLYKQRFDNVWLWQDWPSRGDMPDTGIDLVAKLKNVEGFCAIQCKFYETGHSVSKADIDTFITASDKTVFSERILVSVADDWSKNAEDAIKGIHVPCQRITVE
ncbi:MAG: restriction endonuclease, partial [Firmicutes bacterium]|nr:restriction endonuclease [Bacillota bacterium]